VVVVVSPGTSAGAATAAAVVGRVEVAGGLVVVDFFTVVEVVSFAGARTAEEDVVGEGFDEVVLTSVVDGVSGGVVVGAVAAAGAGELSQLIARALPDPPATCGFLGGVLLEGEPSPPNSTTAITYGRPEADEHAIATPTWLKSGSSMFFRCTPLAIHMLCACDALSESSW
jgi:hypothetical protein